MTKRLSKPHRPCHDKNISGPGQLTGRTYTKADLFAESRPRDLPMNGFEDHYGNLVDYILRCTYDIWEEKNVGVIYTHYGENMEFYTPFGFGDHVQTVVDGTMNTMHSFPNRQLYSINIIWDGNEDDGYLSSHMNRSIAVNTDESIFGPATGEPIDILCVADCLCKENEIIKEWLIRDTGALVRQLGFDLEMVAEKMARDDMQSGITPWFTDDLKTRTSQRKSVPQVAEVPQNAPSQNVTAIDIVKTMLYNIWTVNNFSMLDDYYSYNIQVEGIGGRRICGTPNLKTFLSEIHASMADSDFRIDHMQQMDSDAGDNEKFVHARWSLCGKHATSSIFGQGTGTPIHMMGISHYRLVNGRIAEEWTLFDEVAIWKQIKMAQIQAEHN